MSFVEIKELKKHYGDGDSFVQAFGVTFDVYGNNGKYPVVNSSCFVTMVIL